MERFEEKLREYLRPLEEGKVLYDFSFDLQTMQVVIYPENVPGILIINVYDNDKDEEQTISIVSIDNKTFIETTKENTENILRKAIEVMELDFQVKERKVFRDEDYWRIEKGSFIIKKKREVINE